MNDEDKFFSTKDFYLACFLKVKNLRLVKTTKEDSIATFYFEKVSGLEKLITDFYSNVEMVSAIDFINSIRDLKALIHNI